jgi:succinoglycan biosynthesis transport protein ExoP
MINSTIAMTLAGPEQSFLPLILGRLRRRWIFISLGTVLLFVGLSIAIQFIPKIYEGRASVEVLTQAPNVVNHDIITANETFTDETAGTELEIFNSTELQLAVIDSLGLLGKPEFNSALEPGVVQKVATWLNTTQLPRLLPLGLVDFSSEPVPKEEALYDTLLGFQKLVTEKPVIHSKNIEILARSHDPKLAAAIANAVAQEYIAAHQRQKEAAYSVAHNFTDKRLPELRVAMAERVAAVDNFKQHNNLVSGQYGAILRERFTEATRQLIDAYAAVSRAQGSLAASRGDHPETVPEVLASPTIRDLRVDEARIHAQGEWNAPRLAMIETRIANEARRIVESFPKQLAAAIANLQSQKQTVAAVQQDVARLETAESQLANLQNEANIALRQYNDFATRATETNPDVAFTGVNVQLISAAYVPYKPSWPNNRIMLPAVFVLSLGSMCGIVLTRERRIGASRSVEEIQRAIELDVVGRIPQRKRSGRDPVYENAVEELCTRVFPPWNPDLKKTVLVTSVWPSEGKTTIAAAMTMAAAARGLRAVLVRADMRGRGPAPGQRGLGDVLRGDANLEQVIVHEHGMDVVPAGTVQDNPTHLFASSALPAALNQLQRDYALVIIDAPPAAVGADAWSLSHFANEALLIAKYGHTADEDIVAAFSRLQPQRGDIKLVLNMMPTGGGRQEITYSARMLSYYRS